MSDVPPSGDSSPTSAASQETDITAVSKPEFGLYDNEWSEDQWQQLIFSLVGNGMISWQELAALLLGHLNPSQTGTSLASSEGFKRRYGKGNTMRIVMDWAYAQSGRCEDCGSRLELQADHIKGREFFDDPLDADYIENMTLRCRRCNVVRRPSHELGGQTFLTAESALMWILLVIRPRTFIDFVRLCRLYGMTMSDIRMQEAWAMAHWLSRNDSPLFTIEDDENTSYDLLQWPTGAVTRIDAGRASPQGAVKLYRNVRGDHNFMFLINDQNMRKKVFCFPLSWIAFSTYNLVDMPPYALAVRYIQPDRKKGRLQQIVPLPPVGVEMISHVIFGPSEKVNFEYEDDLSDSKRIEVPLPNHNGKLVPAKLNKYNLQLVVEPASLA